ncbi:MULTISPECIES: hypothetical protein [Vibrio]|uniref:hypothetical protein n=1 Tax=Vibrio TaxID=662 RepID=UPI0012FFFA05|nr:hypothetical protein [Vibrio tasmaniensis]
MTFAEAKNSHPEYGGILDRIAFLAALDRGLSEAEDAELANLHVQDAEWRNLLNLT